MVYKNVQYRQPSASAYLRKGKVAVDVDMADGEVAVKSVKFKNGDQRWVDAMIVPGMNFGSESELVANLRVGHDRRVVDVRTL